MVSTGLDRAAQRYLRQLKGYLADLPHDARESILQDIQAHIEEATESGRSSAEVLAALGQPRTLANASRAELGLALSSQGMGLSLSSILGGITVALAVMGAVVVSFFLRNPEGQHPDTGSSPESGIASLLELYGPGMALLTLIPAAVVLAVHFLPRRVQRWAMIAVALGLSVLVVLDLFGSGLFVLPVAITAWLAASFPYASSLLAGPKEQLAVRIAGTVLLLCPVLLSLGGLMLDNIGAQLIPFLIWVLFSLALAVGFALNSRVAHWALVVYGVFIFGVALFDAGILIAALWMGGGIVLALGLYGLLRLKPLAFLENRTVARLS